MHSTLEKGTTIELWLPLSTVSAEKHSVADPEAHEADTAGLRFPARNSLAVLVVDDDPLVLENTSALLEDLGYRVTAVDSGEAALGLLRGQGHFDILVTDHMMPGMTGAQLADTLQAERPGFPVLLVSGYADLAKGNRRRPTLAKPFTQSSLVLAMNQAMHRPNPGVVVELYPGSLASGPPVITLRNQPGPLGQLNCVGASWLFRSSYLPITCSSDANHSGPRLSGI